MNESIPGIRSESIETPSVTRRFAFRTALLWTAVAAASFHIAHCVPFAGFAIVGFFIGLLNLTRLNNARHGFRWGIALGWLVYVPHLAFFWQVFVPDETAGSGRIIGAVGVFALWMVLPIWLGLFLCLATWLRRWTRETWWGWLIPMTWVGIEYFRSELYPLKFSWLSAGYAFTDTPGFILYGMYGMALWLFVLTAAIVGVWKHSRSTAIAMLTAAVGFVVVGGAVQLNSNNSPAGGQVQVGGIQLEFAPTYEIVNRLDQLIADHPGTELCVLSEYAFTGPVPQRIRDWCRDNERYLIAGGKDPLGTTNFYNTAFVVGPDGEVVFKQVKSVPIQFFADGLPAPTQQVWQSPWGRIGLCICYDLGYTRVTDELVRLGAQAIIAPTMDVEHWGRYQHWLHSRVAPVRAAEYGIPIFRLTSSGISQHVLASGDVPSSLPYPDQGKMLTAQLELASDGRRPLDRWIAPLCVGVTAVIALFAGVTSTRRWLNNRRKR